MEASSSIDCIVTMEEQIKRIIACTQPYEVKKTLLEYCCKTCLEAMEDQASCSVLKDAMHWILDGGEELLVDSGKMIFRYLVKNKKMAIVSFFDEMMILSLLKRINSQTIEDVLDIFMCIFPVLLSSSTTYPKLCQMVGDYITSWLQISNTVQLYGDVAEFLLSHKDCLPVEKDAIVNINRSLIHCLGKTSIPKCSKDEMIEYFKKVCFICELLHMIWQRDTQSFLVLSLKQCFEILSSAEYESTVALAHLTNYVPDYLISSMIQNVIISDQISDQELTAGISKMVHWLVWPKKTQVLHWILAFFKFLVKAGKKNVLENVVLNRIMQVFSRVYMPVVREINFVVLVNMLMSTLDQPTAFHMILPFVPNLMARLHGEKNEKSSSHLMALGELMYTLMHRFPDHGSLYAPLLRALVDIPKPSDEKIKHWLQSSCTAGETKAGSARVFSPESIALMKGTRKTGLVNLGNTCYMNSILQCLLLLDMFRRALMSRRVSTTRCPIMYALQDLFAFLVLSQRDAFAPESFVRQSRPPWFPSRTQQDCCEFVHYMMDRLEEEDKALLQDTSTKNIIDENFKGVLRVTYKCLKCGNESQNKEAFTDILLDFPHTKETTLSTKEPTTAEDENTTSLKGGDQIRKFQNPRTFVDESFEGAKGAVPQSAAAANTVQKNSAVQQVGRRDPCTFTIHEMLDYLMMPEELSGNNQYFCDECSENVDGERCVQICALPKYLMLVLKRFSFDIKLQTKPKLLHIVEYPEQITFCSVDESIKLLQNSCEQEAKMAEHAVARDDDWEMDTCQSLCYKLRAVVVHSGRTCEAGHYYSYALDTQNSKAQWYCFNDERTYETSYETFMAQEKTLLTDTSYILIYDHVTDQDSSNGKFEAPTEMMERVRLDNMKYCKEKNRQTSSPPEPKDNAGSHFDDNDDKSPPPGGNWGSDFSVPGNRFIF